MNAPSPLRTVTPDARPSVLRQDDGPVTMVTLNRAASRNSLSGAMVAALDETFTTLASERSVRAVVLAADGPVFSAGHDLKELTAHRADPDGGRAFFDQIMTACGALMLRIVRLPQPVITAVQGTATA